MVDLKIEKSTKPLIISEKKNNGLNKLIDVAHILTFGKHRNKPFSEVVIEDPNYLKWCIKTINTFKITPEAKKLLYS